MGDDKVPSVERVSFGLVCDRAKSTVQFHKALDVWQDKSSIHEK